MISQNKKEFRIFFSWQSDIPAEFNANAIRAALRAAQKSLKATQPNLNIVVDEATRGTSGSPNIAKKILEKIEKANMLICDITTINVGQVRPCPNPNVTYELGFATALLGEDRIVLIFNKAFGDFPSDLPFDIIQNRVSTYEMNTLEHIQAKKNLAELITAAVKAVIEKNPKTPVQLRGLTREKIEHKRDVENMKWLMSKLHLPTLDEHINHLPRIITNSALWFWEDYNGVILNSRFNLYDSVLKDNVKILHKAWETALSFYPFYHDAPGGRFHVFTNPGDSVLSNRKEKAWQAIEIAKNQMASAFKNILDRLRSDYIEIDVSKLSDKAWKLYSAAMREENDFIATLEISSE